MQFIVRQKYLDELIELYGTPDIKVITGIRRSGKSVLLQEFITYLQSLEEKSNIVMINLQELEFDHLLEYHALHKYILGQYKEGMNNVLLIDEVQMCPQFELAINSKFYLCDPAFRYAVNGTRNMDFVAKKRDTLIYIQVSDNISDETTFEREYSPLLAIRDAYPKMVIARTHHETYDYQGVQVVDICRWLRSR